VTLAARVADIRISAHWVSKRPSEKQRRAGHAVAGRSSARCFTDHEPAVGARRVREPGVMPTVRHAVTPLLPRDIDPWAHSTMATSASRHASQAAGRLALQCAHVVASSDR
jgi:hypothetical protein